MWVIKCLSLGVGKLTDMIKCYQTEYKMLILNIKQTGNTNI
jgi:hypothetical protein